jgi:hypothetical protein
MLLAALLSKSSIGGSYNFFLYNVVVRLLLRDVQKQNGLTHFSIRLNN